MFSKLSNWISEVFIHWLTSDRPYEGAPMCDFERICYEVRPCDVLLIEGRSRVSDIIRGITQSSWSHAALYIGRIHDVEDPKIRNLLLTHYKGSPDTQLLIEGIMGKGTIISKLSTYEKDHIRLCRPKGLSRRDAQQVMSFAIHKLGTEYDVRQAVDLARFLLPWSIMPRNFRSKLFEHHAGESVKTVCSSMIAEAFASVEFPILPLVKHTADQGIELIARNPKLYSPRDFDYSPYFDIIKYPYVEFADYAMYRKLPWNREGLISHDEVGVRSTVLSLEEDSEHQSTQKKKKKIPTALRRFKDRFQHRKSDENIPDHKIIITDNDHSENEEPEEPKDYTMPENHNGFDDSEEDLDSFYHNDNDAKQKPKHSEQLDKSKSDDPNQKPPIKLVAHKLQGHDQLLD